MQFDFVLIIILLGLSTLIVIILIKLIYRHNPHYNEKYGSEIVLFHSTDRYKRRVWRFSIIRRICKILKIKKK